MKTPMEISLTKKWQMAAAQVATVPLRGMLLTSTIARGRSRARTNWSSVQRAMIHQKKTERREEGRAIAAHRVSVKAVTKTCIAASLD